MYSHTGPCVYCQCFFQVIQKLHAKKLNMIIAEFYNEHGTIEQIYRPVNQRTRDLNAKKYYSTVFLDISQAFDKIWHSGLQIKIKKHCLIPNINCSNHIWKQTQFFVKQSSEYTDLHPIHSDVSHGTCIISANKKNHHCCNICR